MAHLYSRETELSLTSNFSLSLALQAVMYLCQFTEELAVDKDLCMLYTLLPTNNEHVLYDLSLVVSGCKVLALSLVIHSPCSHALLSGRIPSVLEQCTGIHHK